MPTLECENAIKRKDDGVRVVNSPHCDNVERSNKLFGHESDFADCCNDHYSVFNFPTIDFSKLLVLKNVCL